jgi:hypothetical protein
MKCIRTTVVWAISTGLTVTALLAGPMTQAQTLKIAVTAPRPVRPLFPRPTLPTIPPTVPTTLVSTTTTVPAAHATGLNITPEFVSVKAGASVAITAMIAMSDGTQRPLGTDEILGANPGLYDQGIATVLGEPNPTGTPNAVQGISEGSTTITYSVVVGTTLLTREVSVSVTSGPNCEVAAFRIRPVPLAVGSAFPIWGYCEGSTTEQALDVPVTWSTSDPAVVDVDPLTGQIYNNDLPGTSLLTAQLADGRTAVLPMAVRVHITGLVATAIEVSIGGEAAVAVEATLNDGSSVSVPFGQRWWINDPTVATYSNGIITGVVAGSTTLNGSVVAADFEPTQTFPADTYVFGHTGMVPFTVAVTVD